MTDLPLILNTRACFSDECYGVIGRALAFATSFECNCKAFEALIEIKKGRRKKGLDFSDEQSMAKFCRELEEKKLCQRTKAIRNSLEEAAENAARFGDITLEDEGFELGTLTGEDLSDLMEFANKSLSEKLEDARKARNEIAHDLTKGIEHDTEDDEGRKNIIKHVETLVRRIAEADVQVYNLCQFLTNEPTFKDASEYCEVAVKWVCEIEDSL